MELNDPLTLSPFIASFIVLIVYVRRTVNIDNGWLSPPDQLCSSRIRKNEGLALCLYSDVCEREREERLDILFYSSRPGVLSS